MIEQVFVHCDVIVIADVTVIADVSGSYLAPGVVGEGGGRVGEVQALQRRQAVEHRLV